MFGGLQYYCMHDITHYATKQFEGKQIPVPCLFIAGKEDVVIQMFGGKKSLKEAMVKSCPKLEKVYYCLLLIFTLEIEYLVVTFVTFIPIIFLHINRPCELINLLT